MALRRVWIGDEIGGGLVKNPRDPTDSARLLRASPPVRRSVTDEGEITSADATEESNYTPLLHSALAGEPEAISREAQEEICRQAREKRERVVMSPLNEICAMLDKLEATGHYKPSKIKFIDKLVRQLGEDAMRSVVDE